MKKILCFIGSAAYGIVFSYLIWLAFYFLTPWIMSFGLLGFVLLWLFGFGIIAGFIGGISGVLSYPLIKMIFIYKPSKYIPVVSMLFLGYSSVAMPWRFDVEYSLMKIILGLSISIMALILFSTLIYGLFKPYGDE